MKRIIYWIIVLLFISIPLYAANNIEVSVYEKVITLNQQLSDTEDPLALVKKCSNELSSICNNESWWSSLDLVYGETEQEDILAWIYNGNQNLLDLYPEENLPHLPSLILFLVHHLECIQPLGSPQSVNFARNTYLTVKVLKALDQLVSRLFTPITFIPEKEPIYGLYELSIISKRPVSIIFNFDSGFSVIADNRKYGEFVIGDIK